MQIKTTTVKDYIEQIPVERIASFNKLRETILNNLPKGFIEQMNYGMIGYIVPHDLYPSGYHCKPSDPLPFANIASQKHFIGFYHMGMYASPILYDWFTTEYAKQCSHKPDMGKSCVRFKKMDEIPYQLIGELMKKMSVDDWVNLYEEKYKK